MSGEELREAARLMRGRAQWAPGGIWSTDGYGEVVSGKEDPPPGDLSSYLCDKTVCRVDDLDYRDEEDAERAAEHIASWHPAVARAVADWLEQWADHQDLHAADVADGVKPEVCASCDAGSDYDHVCNRAALAVARAYLGDPS